MKMKIVCVLLALTAIACDSQEETRKMIMKEFMKKPADEAFEIFLTLYDKPYKIASDEGIQHFINFRENMEFFNQNQGLFSIEIDDTMDLPHSIWKGSINIPQELNPEFPTQTSLVGYLRLNSLCLNRASISDKNILVSWWCYQGGNNSGSLWTLLPVSGYTKVYYIHNNLRKYLTYSPDTGFAFSDLPTNALMLNGFYGTLFTTSGSTTRCLVKKSGSKNEFTITDSCDSTDRNQLFQFAHYFPSYQDSNLKFDGKCLVSEPKLGFEECDGSKRQLMKFDFAFPSLNGRNLINIVDSRGLLLTVNRSDKSVSFQNRSKEPNLIQVFNINGKAIYENCVTENCKPEDLTTGDFIAAVDTTKIIAEKWIFMDKVFSYLNPSNISTSVSQKSELNLNKQFFYTTCFSLYQLDVIFPC